MENKSFLSRWIRLLPFVGLAVMIVPLYIYILWVYTSASSENFFDAVALFKQYLPDFLNGPVGATKISLICSLLSLSAGITGLRMRIFPWRLNMLLVVVSCLLLFLNIFQLM